MPEDPPIVPEHLSERIINLLPETTKIALKVASKGGWQAVCTIHMDGDEDATEVYSAVKAGVDMLTRCCAIDYAADGVRFNAVCPGVVETPIFVAYCAIGVGHIADKIEKLGSLLGVEVNRVC